MGKEAKRQMGRETNKIKEKAKKAQDVLTCPPKKHVMTLCSVYIAFFSYI
jgi:hypothetical protein